MNISNWMSWEGGVDLVGATSAELESPNVIVHVARLVHTPVGSAPSGMILIPNFDDLSAPPLLMGFISSDERVGAYFGPHIFAGTPFENAPVLKGQIEIEVTQNSAVARVTAGEFVIESRFEAVGNSYLVRREAGALPFVQQGVEAKAERVMLAVNGREHALFVPEVGMTGGPGAVVAACGVYAR